MRLDRTYLDSLVYDRIKVVIRLRPVVKAGRISFVFSPSVNTSYSFAEGDGFFVPCYTVKQPVAKMTFAGIHLYEQTRVAGDYGTYTLVPRRVPSGVKKRFVAVPGDTPVFEGFFDNAYDVRAAYADLRRALVERVLPSHNVADPELVERIGEWDVEDCIAEDV